MGRYSGFRVILDPRLPIQFGQWLIVDVVAGYSSATATDLHRLPCHRNLITIVGLTEKSKGDENDVISPPLL